MQIPAVGTQVTVVVKNVSRRNPWDPETLQFAGKIAPTYKWLDADYFCLTTNDPQFPIRSIRQERVVTISSGGNTISQTPASQQAMKTGTWQVKGSKGDIYNGTRNGDRWTCDCVAGQFGRSCRHVKTLQAEHAG